MSVLISTTTTTATSTNQRWSLMRTKLPSKVSTTHLLSPLSPPFSPCFFPGMLKLSLLPDKQPQQFPFKMETDRYKLSTGNGKGHLIFQHILTLNQQLSRHFSLSNSPSLSTYLSISLSSTLFHLRSEAVERGGGWGLQPATPGSRERERGAAEAAGASAGGAWGQGTTSILLWSKQRVGEVRGHVEPLGWLPGPAVVMGCAVRLRIDGIEHCAELPRALLYKRTKRIIRRACRDMLNIQRDDQNIRTIWGLAGKLPRLRRLLYNSCSMRCHNVKHTVLLCEDLLSQTRFFLLSINESSYFQEIFKMPVS